MLGLKGKSKMVSKEDLKKYSREELENIIINTSYVIDRYHIIPNNAGDTFLFGMEGKTYDARVLVDMWNLVDQKAACEVCDYRLKFVEQGLRK